MKFWVGLTFADPTHLTRLARKAEEVGFEGVFLGDHLFFPEPLATRYPYTQNGLPPWDAATPFVDPWCAFSAMAAVTERLRFTVAIYVLPARSPIDVAKACATASVLSGGRVALGAGAGWMKEEFDVVGVDFRRRGSRMEESIEVLRKLWSGEVVEHHGVHFDFPLLSMSPAPPAPIPIFLGGANARSLLRAATLGDGWIGLGHQPNEAEQILDELARLRREAGRGDEPFECIVPVLSSPTPDVYARLAEKGMTAAVAWPAALALGIKRPSLEQEFAYFEQFSETTIRKQAS
jgi:probable F420-dependent oxidoreductase